MGKELPKDHFVPVFYLKRWSSGNKDGKLCSCCFIKRTNKLHWDLHVPSGTAYERGLYREIEEKFFKPLDDNSSKLLTKFEDYGETKTGKYDLSEQDHELWAIFLLAQIIRTPHNINKITDEYNRHGISAEITRDQYPNIICNDAAIKDLRSMKWVFARVDSNLELITCDNPVIFKPNDLSHNDCVIILPLSPRHFFLASKECNFSRLEQNPRKMVSYINIEIIKNAKARIYARSCNSIKESFVMKYWTHK